MATLSIGNYNLKSIGEIELTKSREIFEQPGKRGGDKSVRITIVSNPETNKAFEYYFSVNTQLLTFDPRKKQDAILYFDNTPYFEGIAKLVGVTKEMQHVKYSIVVFGNLIDFFGDIDGKLLKDVNMSEYDHNYFSVNQELSFTDQVFKNGLLTTLPQGEGYRYPNADFGNYDPAIPITGLRPAYYVNEILKKIITSSGYRYTGGWVDSSELKDVAMLSSGEWKMTDAQVKAQTASVGKTGSTLFGNTLLFNPIVFDDEISDPSNQYDDTTGIFQAGLNMEVVVKGSFNLRYRLASSTYTVGNENYLHGFIRLFRRRSGQLTILGDIKLTPVELTANTAINVNDYTGAISCSYDFGSHNIRDNDEIGVVFTGARFGNEDYSVVPAQPRLSWSIEVNVGSSVVFMPSGNIVAGQVVGFANTVDVNVKQSDFVKWIFNKYNIQLDYDKNDPKLLIIKPFDDYYTSDLVELNIDRSKDIEITPVPDELSGRYFISDKKGQDILSERYFGTWGQNHGSRIILTENDFFRGQKEITTGFEPAIMFRVENDDKLTLSFRKEGSTKDPASGIKLGYIKTNQTALPYVLSDGWLLRNATKWVYMGFLDDPLTPTRDLSFGVPESYYHIGITDTFKATDNTAYNRYWRGRILRNQNPNTRLMECYVEIDLVKFDSASFDKLYFVDNAYWRLLQIEKYTPARDGITKVKLISEVPIEAFSGSTEDVGGGSGFLPDGESIPRDDRFDGDYVVADGWVRNGRSDGINPDGMVIGQAQPTGGVSVYSGGSSAVYGGVLINSTSSNADAGDVYICDILQPNVYIVELSSSEILNLHTTPIAIPIVVDSGFYIEVTKVTGFMYGGTTSYSGGRVQIGYVGGSDICDFSVQFMHNGDEAEKPTIGETIEAGTEIQIRATSEINVGDRLMTLKIEYKIWQI
jgi:hypothetical protein